MDKRESALADIRKTSGRVQKVYNGFKIAFIAIIAYVVYLIIRIMSVDSKGFVAAVLEAFNKNPDMSYERMNILEKIVFVYFDRTGLLVLGIIEVAVMCVLTVMTFSQIQKVFKRIAETSRPFDQACLADLRKMVILVTVREFISSAVNGILSGFALYCMLKIYEYGCLLQVEADETV